MNKARLETWLNTVNGRHATELANELVKTLAVDNMMGVTIHGIGYVSALEEQVKRRDAEIEAQVEHRLAVQSKLGESQEQRGRANDELQRLQSVNELLKASLKRSEGQVAEYALRLDSIRAETIQECWDAINKHIPRGTLASIYENESRNGMVLATNILSALKATVVERLDSK